MNTENTFNKTIAQTATSPQPQQGMVVKTGVKAGNPLVNAHFYQTNPDVDNAVTESAYQNNMA